MMRLRARYMAAMGLAACAKNEPQTPTVITLPAPTESAVATATATATVTATPVVATPPVRGLSNVPSFTATYPHQNNRGCSTANAHCYMLTDLQKLAHGGASCPASEDVPQGCAGGTMCVDPDARTTGALLAKVSRDQTAVKGATACCYEVPDLCCAFCGRTLRDGDTVLVTARTTRSDWSSHVDLAPDPRRGARLAAMAAAEHASIASFARTSLDLLALGAPAELVAETHRAALDEIEHARVAYSLASALSGEPIGPAPLALPPHPPATFASLTLSTFLDACVAESIGADDLRAMGFDRIAEDEERHVELAFRTLAWCVRSGGAQAREALEHAIETVPKNAASRRIVADVVMPCAMALLASASLSS